MFSRPFACAALSMLVASSLCSACSPCAPRTRTSAQLLVGTLEATRVQSFAEAIAGARFSGQQPIEARVLSELEAATVQLVRIQGAEQPHRHADHDLVVMLVEGRGTMLLGEHEVDMTRGDAVVIARNVVHAFRNADPAGSVALVVRAPAAASH